MTGAALCTLASPSLSHAQCQPRWEAIGLLNFDAGPRVAVQYDDGTGPALHLFGRFDGWQTPQLTLALSEGFARLRNGQLESLPGRFNGEVLSVVVFDDDLGPNGGPSLYLGGSFTSVTDRDSVITSPGIARWDGTRWHAVGGGVISGSVHALHVHDDGSGPQLYVGGSFSGVNPQSPINSRGIAAWNGQAWSGLSGGIASPAGQFPWVRAITTSSVTGSAQLYIAGLFSSAGGVPAPNIARWTGAEFVAGPTLPPVLAPFSPDIIALAEFTIPSGRGLFISRRSPGNDLSTSLYRWNGGSVGSYRNVRAERLVIGRLPNDPEASLFAIGGQVRRLNFDTWQPMGTLQGALTDSAIADLGDGARLVVAGPVTGLGGRTEGLRTVAAWDGMAWTPAVDDRFVSFRANAVGLAATGGEQSLVLGTTELRFEDLGGQLRFAVAFQDGEGWIDRANLNASVPGSIIDEIATSGPRREQLYLAGRTAQGASGDPASLRWFDGSQWRTVSPLTQSEGLGSSISAIATFRDAQGFGAYVGGPFDSIRGVAFRGIAEVRGTQATPLNPLPPVAFSPEAILAREESGERVLYVASAYGPFRGVYRFDGATWTQLGPSFTAGIGPTSLAFYRGASGTEHLYAAGSFLSIAGVPTPDIARWNGVAWEPVPGVGPTGSTSPESYLTVFNDGSGAKLYWTGSFARLGEPGSEFDANGIAAFDGTSWSPLPGVAGSPGLTSPFRTGTGVKMVATRQNTPTGLVSWLNVAGTFYAAGGVPSPLVARFGGCPVCLADFNQDGQADPFDYLDFVAAFSNENPTADFNNDGQIDLFDYLDFAAALAQPC
ncbi:MAG: hypothetical protein SFZ23_07010 [Planctomycetota bacterium]|nr:hypothetical protein [Planctomycetota bacterium]